MPPDDVAPGSGTVTPPPPEGILHGSNAGDIAGDAGLLTVAAVEAEPKRKKAGLGVGAWLAIGWMALVIFVAIAAPILPVGNPDDTITLKAPCPQVETVIGQKRPKCDIARQGPLSDEGSARGYLLGGDGNGRSMLARLVFGARTSMLVATGAVAVGLIFGGFFGMVAGYFGGKIDTVITGLFNVFLSVPAIIFALALVAFLQQPGGQGGKTGSALPPELTLIIAIGIVSIPLLGRITRASALVWSQREFVLAARAQGAKNGRIMIREVLPNVLPAMFSIALLGIAVAIVAEGTLSILGVGVRPPTPSWGNIIGLDRGLLLGGAPHVVLEPSIVIFLTVLSLNFLGDVIRARFDVREAGI
jgi:peptide/nickel transport system permease protein